MGNVGLCRARLQPKMGHVDLLRPSWDVGAMLGPCRAMLGHVRAMLGQQLAKPMAGRISPFRPNSSGLSPVDQARSHHGWVYCTSCITIEQLGLLTGTTMAGSPISWEYNPHRLWLCNQLLIYCWNCSPNIHRPTKIQTYLLISQY